MKWLKDNWGVVLILFVTLILRLHYLNVTMDQPLWWDEADYLVTSQVYSGLHHFWDVEALRPPLFSVISIPFTYFGIEEMAMRIFVLLSSLGSVLMLYLLTKEMFNKQIGLISSLILAGFWSFTFFSTRILVDVPLTFLILTSLYFFVRADNTGKSGYYLLTGLFLGLSFLMKYTSIVFVGLVCIMWFLNKDRKNINLIRMLIPFVLIFLGFLYYQFAYYGNPFEFYTSAMGTRDTGGRSLFQSTYDQVVFMFDVIPIYFTAAFIFGLGFLIYKLILGYKEKSSALLILWIFICIFMFGKLGYGLYMEERYYFILYPAIFIICGIGLYESFNLISDNSRILGVIGLGIILFLGVNQDIRHGDSIIKDKVESYTQIKEAGLWLHDNVIEGDLILANQETVELIYYSGVDVEDTKNWSSFVSLMNRFPKYVVTIFYFPEDDKTIVPVSEVFQNSKTFNRVKEYRPYLDENNTIPIVTIFEVQK